MSYITHIYIYQYIIYTLNGAEIPAIPGQGILSKCPQFAAMQIWHICIGCGAHIRQKHLADQGSSNTRLLCMKKSRREIPRLPRNAPSRAMSPFTKLPDPNEDAWFSPTDDGMATKTDQWEDHQNIVGYNGSDIRLQCTLEPRFNLYPSVFVKHPWNSWSYRITGSWFQPVLKISLSSLRVDHYPFSMVKIWGVSFSMEDPQKPIVVSILKIV